MKIGIFGGSFDPPHMGHVWICNLARETAGLDEIYMIPNLISPLKQNKTVDKEHIYIMSGITANFAEVQLDTIELDGKFPSYMINTVKTYRKRFKKDELFLVIGSDTVPNLYQWKDIDEIFTLLGDTKNLIVVPRANAPLISGAYTTTPLNPVQISSTELRERIKQNKTVKGLMPPALEMYIREEGLYE
jgi:nicotinate-nucleotide adenylyltransferase